MVEQEYGISANPSAEDLVDGGDFPFEKAAEGLVKIDDGIDGNLRHLQEHPLVGQV